MYTKIDFDYGSIKEHWIENFLVPSFRPVNSTESSGRELFQPLSSGGHGSGHPDQGPENFLQVTLRLDKAMDEAGLNLLDYLSRLQKRDYVLVRQHFLAEDRNRQPVDGEGFSLEYTIVAIERITPQCGALPSNWSQVTVWFRVSEIRMQPAAGIDY